MQEKTLTNNIWFRLFVPLIMGVIAYMVILMSSDRLSQFFNLFFGAELVITVIASYLVFSIVRILIVLFFQVQVGEELRLQTIIVQTVVTIIVGMLLAALPITVYMRYFLGYSSFDRELNFFIIIFGLSVIFYNLFYFSLYYLNKKNTFALEYEKQLHLSLLKEFHGFIRDIHPEFFNLGMETLLVLIRKDKNLADKYINKFSGVFRYIIEAKKKELTTLSEETEQLKGLLFIFNQKYHDRITLDSDLKPETSDYKLIPCTLHSLLEHIVLSSIITKDSPLQIKFDFNQDELVIEHNGLERINIEQNIDNLKQLSESQKYLTGKAIQVEKLHDKTILRFPVLIDEIEPLE